MKRRIAFVCSLSLAAALLLGGCSSSVYGKYLTLGDYKGLSISKIKAEVTDEMLEEELAYVLDDSTEYTEVERSAADGDMVNINYSAIMEGETLEENSEEDVDLELGAGYLEGYFLEEAEDDLIGMKAGDTKEVDITLSDDYFDETLAGKKLTVSLTLNTVSEIHRPELTDEFVSSISDFTTVDEYKEDLRSTLLASSEENSFFTAGNDALSQVIQNSTFKGYPQDLYDQCRALYDQTNQAYAEMLGLDISEFAMSEEDAKEAVESMVYEEMVIAAIAEKEKISVSDDEYRQYVEANLLAYEMTSVEEFEAVYTKESTMNEILREKVLNFLMDNAVVTEVSEEEYYQAFESYEGDSTDIIDLGLDESSDDVTDESMETEE